MSKSSEFNGANDNSNIYGGMMIMTSNSIMTMEVFVGTVKAAIEGVYGVGYRVEVRDVVKNNNRHLTGLSILKVGSNMAPTIYLEEPYEKYSNGVSLEQICKDIIHMCEDNKVDREFDVTSIMDFEQVKNRICYKLVNAERNDRLLSDAPHIIFHDLAVIFYILVSKDSAGTGTITIRNNIKDIWDNDTDTIYSLALENTQRLFRGKVSSMSSVISEIIKEKSDDEFADEFFEIIAREDDMVPIYVATNAAQLNGAGVIFYHNLLKEFAERIGSDFFILPSSVHEVLFVPVLGGANARELVAMVKEVNATQVADDEILSDNIYRYNRATELVKRV